MTHKLVWQWLGVEHLMPNSPGMPARLVPVAVSNVLLALTVPLVWAGALLVLGMPHTEYPALVDTQGAVTQAAAHLVVQ